MPVSTGGQYPAKPNSETRLSPRWLRTRVLLGEKTAHRLLRAFSIGALRLEVETGLVTLGCIIGVVLLLESLSKIEHRPCVARVVVERFLEARFRSLIILALEIELPNFSTSSSFAFVCLRWLRFLRLRGPTCMKDPVDAVWRQLFQSSRYWILSGVRSRRYRIWGFYVRR